MFLFQFSIFIFIFVHKNIIIGSLPKWILLGFSFGFMACILFIGHETKWTPQWKSKWKLVLAINILYNYVFFLNKNGTWKKLRPTRGCKIFMFSQPGLECWNWTHLISKFHEPSKQQRDAAHNRDRVNLDWSWQVLRAKLQISYRHDMLA